MWYSIITTGKCKVTQSWKEVKQIKEIYLYPKIRSHSSEEAANDYIKTYGYKEAIKRICNYGNTIKGFTVHAKYKIAPEALYLFFDVRDIGDVMLTETQGYDAVIERTGYVTRMKIEKLKLDNTRLSHHLRAVQTLVDIFNNAYCLNIHIQYFGVYYALTMFPRNSEDGYGRYSTEDTGIAYTYGDYQEE